jgi:hypothetical protein
MNKYAKVIPIACFALFTSLSVLADNKNLLSKKY